MIVVKVRDRDIKAAPMGPVTTGSVGLPVSWHFSEEWDDLAKTAVFRVGNDGTEITVAVLEDMCLVPDELLVQANAGENLWIGVYGWKGTNANDTIVPEIAMPTIWTYTRIQDGSQPSGIEPPEGTPGWSAQIQNATNEALRVAHGVAADAAAGEFDGISPAVTITEITHGHSVTITDREHPTGQSFPVLDGDSAYEQAVAGGYTGTEAQFNEELRSFKALSDETKEAAPFYAEYGVTTKAEIETAINGKRQIYVHSALGMDYAPLVGTFLYLPMFGNVPQTGYRFATIEGTTQYIYDLRDEWSTSENDLSAPADRAEQAADQALILMNSADASAQDAEAYAIGKRKGIDVGSTDPAYHNNSKYYAEQAGETVNTFTGTTVPAAVQTVNTAGQTQVGAVNTAGQTQTQAVNTAGQTALTAVSGAQTAAVSAVQTESTTQQAAIEQKGEDVLDSIPSDYTELSGDVADLKSAVAHEANFNFVHVISTQYPAPYNALSTVFDCGLYGVRGSAGYMPADAPAGFSGGSLLILPAYQERTTQRPPLNQTQKVQMLIDPVNKKIWMRYANASNVWRDWFIADMSMPVTALAAATPNVSGFTSSSFVVGGISEAGGNSSNSHRIRSVYIAKDGKTSIRYAIPDGYRLQIAFYSNNSGTQVSRTNWMTGEGRIGFPNSATYFRLQFASIGDSIDLTPANDYNRIAISYGYELIDHPPYITTPTKWLAVGDSITYGVCSSGANASSVGTGWARFLANSLGYTMYNMGVRGMGYVTAGSNGITWADTLDNIDALTDDYNLITIMLGINDYNNSAATLDSIAAALDTGITRILAKYPNARLVVFTPFNARNRGTAENLYDYGYGYPTSSPRTLKDIADKIMEVCAQRGIECHNVSNGCLLNPSNMTGLLLDSIHPSQDCHKLLSKAMARYLIY